MTRWVCFHCMFRCLGGLESKCVFCIIFFSGCVIMNQSNANASHSMWRPPYPSENLKTPRLQSHQSQQPEPLVKTFSTTNPYAEPDQQPAQCNQFQEFQEFQDFQDHQHSKRENNSDKIYERGLTPQMGMNPFLKDNNYLQDLDTQNQFLKPVNTNLLSSNDDNQTKPKFK